MARLTLIAAMDLNHGIGIDNQLPWSIPEDLRRFKCLTFGHPVIMGRKTFESLGGPLPGRRNIVITRNREWRHEGVEVAYSIVQAVSMVHHDLEAFVIGGGRIFEQAMIFADRILLTLVYSEFRCDSFFPYFDRDKWRICDFDPQYSRKQGLAYTNITYEHCRSPHRNPLSVRERFRYFVNGFKEGLAFTPVWNFWVRYGKKGSPR